VPKVGVVGRARWRLPDLHWRDGGGHARGRGGRAERDEVPGQAGSLVKDDNLVVDGALVRPRGEVFDLERIARVGGHHRHKVRVVRVVVGAWGRRVRVRVGLELGLGLGHRVLMHHLVQHILGIVSSRRSPDLKNYEPQ
jgi:hypothetical protein